MPLTPEEFDYYQRVMLVHFGKKPEGSPKIDDANFAEEAYKYDYIKSQFEEELREHTDADVESSAGLVAFVIGALLVEATARLELRQKILSNTGVLHAEGTAMLAYMLNATPDGYKFLTYDELNDGEAQQIYHVFPINNFLAYFELNFRINEYMRTRYGLRVFDVAFNDSSDGLVNKENFNDALYVYWNLREKARQVTDIMSEMPAEMAAGILENFDVKKLAEEMMEDLLKRVDPTTKGESSARLLLDSPSLSRAFREVLAPKLQEQQQSHAIDAVRRECGAYINSLFPVIPKGNPNIGDKKNIGDKNFNPSFYRFINLRKAVEEHLHEFAALPVKKRKAHIEEFLEKENRRLYRTIKEKGFDIKGYYEKAIEKYLLSKYPEDSEEKRYVEKNLTEKLQSASRHKGGLAKFSVEGAAKEGAEAFARLQQAHESQEWSSASNQSMFKPKPSSSSSWETSLSEDDEETKSPQDSKGKGPRV